MLKVEDSHESIVEKQLKLLRAGRDFVRFTYFT